MKMLILSRKLVFCSMIVRIFSGSVPFKPWGFSQKAVQAEQSIKKENKMGTMPIGKLLANMALRRFGCCNFGLLSIFYNSAAAVVNEFDDAVMRIDAGEKNAQIY